MLHRKSAGPFAGLVAIWFVQSLATNAMLPFVVIWAHRYAGLSGVWAGILFVGQAIGEFAGGVAGGGLADRLGRRRILLVSTTGMALGYGLLGVAVVPWLAIVLFLIAGVFESAFHPTVGALVADVTADEQLTRAFGLMRIGSNLGRILGPLLGALAALAALPAVFAVSGVFLALGVLIELAVLPRDRPIGQADEEAEIPPGTLRALRADKRLTTLVLAGGLLSVTFAWWEADGLVVIRQQTPLSTTAYAALFTVAAAIVVAAQLPITRLTEQAPPGRVLLLGALGQAAGLAILIAAHAGYVALVVAVILMALGEMVYMPMVSTVVARRAPADQRASYQAALSITEDIGTAVGPISGLALARGATAVGLWTLGTGLSAIAGLASRAATRRPSALRPAARC